AAADHEHEADREDELVAVAAIREDELVAEHEVEQHVVDEQVGAAYAAEHEATAHKFFAADQKGADVHMGDAKHKGVEGAAVNKSQVAVSSKAIVYRPAENHAPASVGATARSYSEGATADISAVKSTEGADALGSLVAHKRAVSDKAATAEQVGVDDHVGAAELEGATAENSQKRKSEGKTQALVTDKAVEFYTAEEHASVGAIVKVADTALTGTEPYWDASLVIRATSSLEEYEVKATAAATPLISLAAGIPASLVHKDLTPNIVPNFRREENVGALWDELGDFGALNCSWMAIGDFNIVATSSEKKGGRNPNQRARNEFVDFINNNSLRDTTTLGLRFRNIWLEHPQFMDLVRESWQEPMADGPIQLVMRKLKRLKIALKEWHKITYWGNKDKLKQANLSLQKLQKQQEHESLDLQMQLQELKMEKLIDQLMQTEASMWKQRACIKEEIEGDRNSTYFQAKAKIRQDKAFIEELRTAKGNILQDQKSIKEYLVHSYEEKFKARPVEHN
ncbi:hypothetical protein IFM89_020397, partial [Coptis chinensis]